METHPVDHEIFNVWKILMRQRWEFLPTVHQSRNLDLFCLVAVAVDNLCIPFVSCFVKWLSRPKLISLLWGFISKLIHDEENCCI